MVDARDADRAAGGPPIWERTPRPIRFRVLNALGAGLRRVGYDWPTVTVDQVLWQAKRRTGLSDFGDDGFREGLRVLVDAFKATDSAHALGRVLFNEYCTGLLVNRLKLQRDLKRHPEILQVPVPRPLMVTGLPRSGTTLLHRLLSEDPAGRPLRLWEALEPSPPPEPATAHKDPRIARVRGKLAYLHKFSPRLTTAHDFSAESPEEDNSLFANSFAAGINAFYFDVPDYVHWLYGQDLTPGYMEHKRQLQHLSWKLRREYWILKAPAYMFGLTSLLSVYPDANIVITHRNPRKVTPSLCSLAAATRAVFSDQIDLRRLGDDFLNAFSTAPTRMIAARANADPTRFLDVSYEQLLADPIGTVRATCAHFGYAFTPEYEARTRRYLAENPQHKHGVHTYALADFGLTADRVNSAFADYREWLDARLPRGVLAKSGG